MANKDRIEGKTKEVVGSVQAKAGELRDDPDMEARGEARKQEGKAQNLWGKAKDKVEDVKEEIEEHLPKARS